MLPSLSSTRASSSVSPSAPDYVWRNAQIGGGGYVTGIALHPTAVNERYIRTDVGGVFHWGAQQEAWRPLLDGITYPERNYIGVDGLALAPSRPGRLAVAAGQYVNREPSDVLWSDDAGRSWRTTGLNRRFGGNMPHRMNGECLAFAPNDADHLLVGTRNDGLFETRDAGATWRHVAEVPAGTSEIGIRCLVCGTACYAAVDGVGIFRSEDRGTSWHLLLDSPRHVGRMALRADGVLFVAARNPGAVWRFESETWRNISPMGGRNYHALALDPRDPVRVLVSPLDCPSGSRFRLPMFLSLDSGESWRVVSPEIDWGSAMGWIKTKPSHFAAATSSFAFDPHHSGRVYFTDWYAVWMTDDIADRPVQWRPLMRGHEEMFLFAMVSTPTGAPLLTGMADNVGFRHEDLDISPTVRIAGGQEASGIDFCEADPDRVAVLAGCRSPTLDYALYVSDDNGRSFVRREVPVTPDFERALRIAVSATQRENFVMLANSDVPHVTTDAGRSWTVASGVPAGALPGRELWTFHHPLAADRVTGQFYLFHSGAMYVTRDGGQAWSQTSAKLPECGAGFINVVAAPGQAGVVAVGLGDAGLWLSEDAGETFTVVPAMEECLLVTWGCPLPGATGATLFVYGRRAKTWGIFRSVDRGCAWERITTDAQPLGTFPSCLAGDRQKPGRVFLGTNGRGVFYGEPVLP